MTSFYEKFSTDAGAESTEGVVLDYGSAGKIRIHRAGGSNQRFKNYAQAKMKPYARQLQTGTMEDGLARQLMIDVFANTVIVGWEAVKGRDGKDIPYSKENVVKLMTDLPDLFDDIQRAANDHSLFLDQVNSEFEGNSPAPTDGNSETTGAKSGSSKSPQASPS